MRKTTGLKSLQINCWENNQVTGNYLRLNSQIDFLDKTWKKGPKQKKKNISIKFYFFKIVYNQFQNILRLFYVLLNFPVTVIERMCDYYL